MNNNVEILAPVGGMDSLVAAARCGANAVYLGAGNFNARRNATNFSLDELKSAIEYCHVRGIKVYITLNTLVSDSEIPDVLSLIECGCAFGADAFIIQDLGIAKLVREVAPDMPMHASTQMAVSTVAGINRLIEMGFKRVVIPRELSLQEIREICENTDVELEMFVHGALCMSVSGQCYMSGMLGGRSGNRGLCAQPCRLPFAAPGGTGHDLSLKDLSLLEHLPELAQMGINSFKIEGRMKRPEYVAAAVSACKNSLEGRNDECLTANLKAVFSRSGFTQGYFTGELGRNMFGTRGKEDVTAAAAALKELTKLYKDEPETIPISMALTAEIGQPLSLSAATGRIRVFTSTDHIVEAAENHATDIGTIRTQLKKTGGTPFSVKDTEVDMDENVNIPLSELNRIRRSVLALLEHKLCENASKQYTPPAKPLKGLPEHTVAHIQTVIRLANMDQLPDDLSGISQVIVPLASPEEKIRKLAKIGISFGVEIPRAVYGNPREINKKLKDVKKLGAKFAYVGTIDGIELARKNGFHIMGGFTLNAYNSDALAEYASIGVECITVSTELTLGNITDMRGDLKRGICAYGRTPLMLTRNCPIKNGTDCKTCKQSGYLTDRMGIRFPVVCNNGCSEILNSRPIYMSDRINELKNLDFMLLYFTKETKEKIAAVLDDYKKGAPAEGEFTRGLYYRGVE